MLALQAIAVYALLSLAELHTVAWFLLWSPIPASDRVLRQAGLEKKKKQTTSFCSTG